MLVQHNGSAFTFPEFESFSGKQNSCPKTEFRKLTLNVKYLIIAGYADYLTQFLAL